MSAHAADQNSGFRKIILVLLALGVVSMVSLIVAGATSLISLADRIHPVAGTVVFWALCLAAGFLALYCAIAYAQTLGHKADVQTLKKTIGEEGSTDKALTKIALSVVNLKAAKKSAKKK